MKNKRPYIAPVVVTHNLTAAVHPLMTSPLHMDVDEDKKGSGGNFWQVRKYSNPIIEDDEEYEDDF